MLPFEVPLRLIMGTSVGENWLILPDGMELPYLLWLDWTGGRSFIRIKLLIRLMWRQEKGEKAGIGN